MSQGRNDRLLAAHDVETSYLRLRAIPFNQGLEDFIRHHDRVYVVEQNRDGQMHDLIRLEVEPEAALKLRSVRHYNGLPISPRSVVEEILAQEGIH